MSLFGGLSPQVRAKNLVEFKAGKMNLRGNMVYPDKRKGLVYLYQGNDMLMHLCWRERSSNTPEDDLVIFPDEIEFKKVTQNTTGRVYVLKWKSNARKFFFWMQEPKDDKDDEFCKKINDSLNHPPSPDLGNSSSGSHPLHPLMERMAGGGAGGIDPSDLSNVLRGMNPNEFASLLSTFGRGGSGGAASLLQGLQRGGGSMGASAQQRAVPTRANTNVQQTATSRPNTAPTATRTIGTTSTSTSRTGSSSSTSSTSTTAATVPSATAGSTASSGSKPNTIQMSALTNVLANLNNSTTEKSVSESSLDPANSETLIPLLSNKNIQEKLRPHLPEGHSIPSTEKELKESIQSPEYRQITNAFSTAFQSGELKSILSQLDISEEVTHAANHGDFQVFIQALAKHYKNQTKSSDNTMDTN